MCDPVTLTLAATAVTAGGQLYSGIYASQQAGYQAQIAQQNKDLSRESAQDAIARGQEEQERLGRETAQRVGSQRARLSANNVDTGFGSAARVIEDTQNLAADEADVIAENTRRQVRSFQIDAYGFESERRAALAEKKSAKIGTAFAVAGTALGGATQYSGFKAKRGIG
jgi:hypothetical protein